MYSSDSEKIVVCETCSGEGFLVRSVLTDYHKGEYDETKVDCGDCLGSGLLRKRETISYTPVNRRDFGK